MQWQMTIFGVCDECITMWVASNDSLLNATCITIIANDYELKEVGITPQNTKMFVGVSYLFCRISCVILLLLFILADDCHYWPDNT